MSLKVESRTEAVDGTTLTPAPSTTYKPMTRLDPASRWLRDKYTEPGYYFLNQRLCATERYSYPLFSTILPLTPVGGVESYPAQAHPRLYNVTVTFIKKSATRKWQRLHNNTLPRLDVKLDY
ncbi:hypothetical protein TEQG_04890 [Trichophyton equinum CBS 127.97]|uniref:Uncharacterized protein n=1 Tax=Trichophyton equinum (strain ATCC MYA-4606 / CBS 127.97) TaxID=559882 RepID=F2PVG1_TRIEC|nr:hypothetical protein TEQG_04890 [Trichophyton equinum CBS 127.97]